MRYTLLAYLFFLLSSCNGQEQPIIPGAAQLEKLLSETEGKNIAIVANQTSLVDGNHLVDTLFRLSRDRFSIRKIFAPEHGFRGDVDDGVAVSDDIDKETGIPVISLYGKNKKPNKDQLQGIDMVIFDIQDVGVRFYTFISTLHYVMEACAEERIPVVILDRPNPNG
ncbi:MAG: exo-beta-N-acetylmuramidase NamZ domain-containing protein, partial [Bacteroidales bacterium]